MKTVSINPQMQEPLCQTNKLEVYEVSNINLKSNEWLFTG